MKQHIENLILYEVERGVIDQRDAVYIRNQLYQFLHLSMNSELPKPFMIASPSDALTPLVTLAISEAKLNPMFQTSDQIASYIMNFFTALPSQVEQTFYGLYEKDKASATDWYYRYMQDLNYIQMDRIKQNKHFVTASNYGKLEITINKSKPEKDPLAIIQSQSSVSVDYPVCALCIENEGYLGHAKRDPKSQHRMINVTLNHKKYYFQYSPYIYFNEHSIVLSEIHRPMHMDHEVFDHLLQLCEMFEGYFFGSNAELPIVGGSILSHDHYQGGKHRFPIEDAKVIKKWPLGQVELSLLKWPLSTLRIRSTSKALLLKLASTLLDKWRDYNNPTLGIISHTADIHHNTVTPIARLKHGVYEMDMILRNNGTTLRYPLGIFHPHEDKWHIKKENIGLIEAMGLAVLPARLDQEINDIKAYLLGKSAFSLVAEKHKSWATYMKDHYDISIQNIDQVIEKEIGSIFEKVLEDCGVFKQDAEGTKTLISWVEEQFL